MVKIPYDRLPSDQKESMKAYVEDIIVESEKEYREFVQRNEPPDGHVFARTSLSSDGAWKVIVKKEPEIPSKGTELETTLQDHLDDWGYLSHFEHDYRENGRQIDFADVEKKLALEPGAVWWHTPDDVEGESMSEIGEHPSEVYSPVKERDIQKHKTLSDSGWDIIWITERGVKREQERVKEKLDNLYRR